MLLVEKLKTSERNVLKQFLYNNKEKFVKMFLRNLCFRGRLLGREGVPLATSSRPLLIAIAQTFT